ncbi:eukaryotic translation initiation factor 2-alpha kinase, partial [Coemansia sp. RSA 2559]
LPALRRMPIVLMINHMGILEAVLAYCGILPPPASTAAAAGANTAPDSADDNATGGDAQFVRNVCFCLSGLYKEKAQMIRQRIQVMSLTTGAKLHPHSLDRLQPFMDIRGDLNTVQREVLARIGSECGMGGTAQAARGIELARNAARAFSELRYVEATVRHFGVAVPIAYAPLFNHHYAYYEGAYAFQFMTESSKSKVPQVLAIGGRYDGLLRRFRHLAGGYLPPDEGSSESGDRKPRGKAPAAASGAAGSAAGPSSSIRATAQSSASTAAASDGAVTDSATAAAATSANDRLSSISFARRTGSLHSTNVWQQMYSKAAQQGKGSRDARASSSSATPHNMDDDDYNNSSLPVNIGTSLSDGSAALGTARDVVCVGVQIHLDLVIQEMARYQQKVLQTAENSITPTFGLWTRKRCDVVVASFGTHPMLKERIALARELWANGLRTDFLFNDDPEMTMERLVEICSDQGMNWIVTLKRKPSATKFIYKVKNILRRVECEVPRDRLIDWLHTDISEQLKMDLLAHETKGTAGGGSRLRATGAPLVSKVPREDGSGASLLARALVGGSGSSAGGSNSNISTGLLGTGASSAGVNTGGTASGGGGGTLSDATNDPASGRLELTIVNPQFASKNLSRTKHKQKIMLSDRAMGSVSRVINDVKSAPVLVLDLGPELLRRLGGEPSILTDAGYKRIMELCSAHQRAYVVELHTSMERYKREGCLYVWLYSVKGDYAITYKL